MSIQGIEEAKRLWLKEAEDNQLGLWWIADDVRELMPDASEEEVRRATLGAVGSLMRAGAIRAAEQAETGDFKPWGGTVDEQIARIDAEWSKLKRRPIIGDVVWFIGGAANSSDKR